MLPRIIPVLLFQKGGLVKTVNFRKPKYIGDPINAVKIFNDKEVDELVLIDIDATREGRPPNFDLIDQVASECFMPLCYGGGVTTIEQMRRTFSMGVEKVSLSATAISNPALIEEAVKIFGGQSVIVTMDVTKRLFGKYCISSHNARKKHKSDPVDFAVRMAKLGVGELIVNDVDNDGKMQGYDLLLVKRITEAVDIPVVALGGAGSLDNLRDVIKEAGAAAAAAGSLFVFNGVHRAVMINYPIEFVRAL